jgi:hypothetical protein
MRLSAPNIQELGKVGHGKNLALRVFKFESLALRIRKSGLFIQVLTSDPFVKPFGFRGAITRRRDGDLPREPIH